MKKFEDLPIGIDLGTTFSCIGVYRNGSVEIIPNEIGDRITPSLVEFWDDEIYIGEQTQFITLENPKNRVYAIKRIIGRNYNDPEVKQDIANFSYKVVNNKGNPQIKITGSNGESDFYSPEEISAKVLAKLKESAETFLQKSIKKVVITVPAYFTERQKKATKNAGIIAGLEVIKIVNEPTAAALAYGFGKLNNNFLNSNKKNEKEIQKILVFDLGGGTLDVTLLELEKDDIRIKAHSGRMHLGGEDFDNAIVNFCIEKFNRKTRIDLNKEEYTKEKYRLKIICEKAKRELTDHNETEIEVESIIIGKNLVVKLTRAKFENLCKDLFLKCLEPIEEVLEISKEKKENIDEIILIGGSTRIPKIQETIKQFFNGKELNCNLNPDEAVAYGATIEAAMEMQQFSEDVALLDVCPFSLGVGVTEEDYLDEYGLFMETIIKRGSYLPFRAKRIYTPVVDYQRSVLIKVYEGERKYVNDNYFLGEFTLDNIPLRKKNDIHIDIIFDLDENSILTVTGIVKENNSSNSLRIKNDKGGLSKNEILLAQKRHKNEKRGKNIKILMENERNYKQLINNYSSLIKTEQRKPRLLYYQTLLKDNIEQFIDFFRKNMKDNLDNFTLKEKIHFYLKYLFATYSWLLNSELVTNQMKKSICINIKKYLDIFNKKDLRYCPSLLEIFINNDNNIFGENCIYILKYYLEKGKNLYKDNDKKLAKYYLEEILNINKKFLLEKKLKNYMVLQFNLNSILNESNSLINSLKSESIEKYSPSYIKNKLIDEKELKNKDQALDLLDKFKEALRYIINSNNKKDNLLKAIYYANIIKIEYKILQSIDYDSLLKMIEECISLKNSSDDKSTPYWFNEIIKYKIQIEEKNENSRDENEDEEIIASLAKTFRALDEKFEKGEIDFFFYIIKNHKPNGLEQYFSFNSKRDIEKFYNENRRKFLNKIIRLYNPQRYRGNTLEARKIHHIMQNISQKLNFLAGQQ